VDPCRPDYRFAVNEFFTMRVSMPFEDFNAPAAERRPVRFSMHGTDLVDDYAWLKDERWQEVLHDPQLLAPDIRAHIEAENAYAARVLDDTKDLQALLTAEMRGRIKEADSSVPAADGPFEYLHRFRDGGQHELIARIPRGGGEERVLIDGDELAKGSDYFTLGPWRNSPDHRLEAWSADRLGSEYLTIRVRDWDTGEDLPDLIEDTDGKAVWSADSKSFIYVKFDENHRPLKVFRHRLGTPQGEDQCIFEEKDVGWFARVHESSSGRYCVIATGDHETSERWLIDLSDPTAMPFLVAAREPGLVYSVSDRGDTLYILTNADGAMDFKIVTAPLADGRRSNWIDLIPHRPGIYISEIDLYANHMVRLQSAEALPSIVVRDLASGDEHAVGFREAAFTLSLDGGYEFDTTVFSFTYSSMTTPDEIYDYDMAAQTRILRKRREIPSGHNASDYVTARIMAPAPDGELVPVSILHRKGLVLDGSAPLLVYGYGSYGDPVTASFSFDQLSLVDRGFVYAVAHVRGGADKGWGWYLDGKRERKTNTFDDFVAVTRALIAAGYSSEKRVVAYGRSAGGMLMGAIANRAGELYAGIVAEVPFVDVINTMSDATLPLVPPEWPEWGNPITDEEAFRNMLSYSPYDNVSAKEYPAILAVAGLTDPRVTYWEPAKWVARLRATMTGGGPVILQTNMGAGHGGAPGRFDQINEIALVYAFALKAVGISGDFRSAAEE
jgi:oligopeptidase B